MRLFERHDLALLAALTVALSVIFSTPLARLLEYAREMERSSGLELLPALVILATVFMVHQVRKRAQVQAEAASAAAVAQQATERAAEMERLVAFSRALAKSLDTASIREAVSAHLPLLTAGRPAWTMVPETPTGDAWTTLAACGDSTAEQRERATRGALGTPMAADAGNPDTICFPMIIAGRPLGVLGVPGPAPLSEQQHSVLTAAAAMLAVSLKNAELFQQVHENSVRDVVTGCVNRRHAMEVMDAELRRARRSHLPLSLVMFDLDHFKAINDSFGHLCGDAVLATVGVRMRAALRGSDLKCRYGGEEFLILLPDTPLFGAHRVAEILRLDIESHVVAPAGGELRVTASFGVTEVEPGELDALAVIARADAALYQAKQAGRNCVRVAQPAAMSVAQSTQII